MILKTRTLSDHPPLTPEQQAAWDKTWAAILALHAPAKEKLLADARELADEHRAWRRSVIMPFLMPYTGLRPLIVLPIGGVQ